MDPVPAAPQDPQQIAAALRAQGLPEEFIAQILGMGDTDPSGLNKQYEQSAYLRRGATSGNHAKNAYGALAQGIMGYGAGTADKEYKAARKGMEDKTISGRARWFREKYPSGQVSSLPSMAMDPEQDPYQ